MSILDPAAFTTVDDPPFELFAPAQQRVPFVFNSPHSGSAYPPDFVAQSPLPLLQLRGSEDVLVDHLFASVMRAGAPLLAARFPRAWLDVNREPYELDPTLFRERLPGHANVHSQRVAAGLGTVPRLICEGRPIYSRPPTLAEGLDRIENVYRPYHAALGGLLQQTQDHFGYCVLVDCHSMPSFVAGTGRNGASDIVIGDRYGTSCHGDISIALIEAFASRGYHVSRNKPYAGGFITEHYGRPAKRQHAIQIEINRALYLDEKNLIPNAHFDSLVRDIADVVDDVLAMWDGNLRSLPFAAE